MVSKQLFISINRSILVRVFDTVHLHIGSGVWLQQQSTYIQVEERQEIPLTEHRILICVSSRGVMNFANWYFLGEDATGEGELISDMIERDNTRGFLKLTIPTSISDSRLGYYYCSIKVYTDLYNIETVRHTIRISSTQTLTAATTSIIETSTKSPLTTTPLNTQTTTTQSNTQTTTTQSNTQTATTQSNTQTTTTPSNTQTTPVPSATTTTIYSIPSTQIQLSYTPDYDVVFIGVDDVIVTCVATNENSLQLHVSLFDVNNENLLKEDTDNDGRVEIDERIELVKGNLTYKCIAVTEIGSEEAFISIRAESELLE